MDTRLFPHLLIIVTSAVMNIHAQNFFFLMLVLSFLRYTPGSEIAIDKMVILWLTFSGPVKLFPTALHYFQFLPARYEGPNL